MTAADHHAIRPLDAGAIALIVLLCLCWGFNQVAVKLALPDIPPLIQASIRTAGATLMVAVWAFCAPRPADGSSSVEVIIAG